jgi:hypothetical protein
MSTLTTPPQDFAHEGLLHIHGINKTPMTPRQAVDACLQFSKRHTFIANERTGRHISTFGAHSLVSDYSISVFDGMEHIGFYTNKTGFEELVQQVESLLFPPPTLKLDEEPDPGRFADDAERHEFETVSSDDQESGDEDE